MVVLRIDPHRSSEGHKVFIAEFFPTEDAGPERAEHRVGLAGRSRQLFGAPHASFIV